MPNTKAQMKHLKQTKKRTVSNSLVKRNIKEIIKQGQKSVVKGDIKDRAGELVYNLQKSVDKAAKAGIIKPNTANRKKKRFAQLIKKSGGQPVATSPKTKETEKK